mgnify:CR=1 FL=1
MNSVKTSVRLLAGAVGLLLTGCAIGPNAMTRDRFDYNAAISDSWKSQMLLNIVKVRYGDAPIFLDVASVINSYEVSGGTNLGASWTFNPSYQSGSTANVTGFFANRPTITYSPLTGERFTRSMMTPLPPSSIFFLIQAGYPADAVFRAMVQSVNGIRNRYGASGRNLPADPEFYDLIKRLREIQDSGVLELRVEKETNREANLMVLGRSRDEKIQAQGRAVRKMLGIDPQVREFKVVYGTLPSNDKEIAIITRSVLQLIIDLGSFVEVPDIHVAENWVLPTLKEQAADGSPVPPMVRIHSGTRNPGDAFAAVPYQGHWFWIDNRDLRSKGIFSFLMFIFNLVDTGAKEGTPVITIPAR